MKNEIVYSIRAAQREDLDTLYEMLLDLVKHEGSYDRFKLTRQRLEVDLFGATADWYAQVAVTHDNALLGFCLYSFANISRAFNVSPMIQIDELYVCPKHRRANIGHRLMQEVAAIAHANGRGRLNVWCVKNNTIGQNFYNKIGAGKRDFIDVYSIPVETLLS